MVRGTKHPATLFGIPPSRNRGDILREIEGETVQPSHVELEGHLVIWHTTPAEMRQLSGEFAREYRGAGQSLHIISSGCLLDICRPGRANGFGEWEPGVRIRGAEYANTTTQVTIFVYPSVLIRAAEKLADAPWDRKKAGREYGADRRVLKFRTGDDIITVFWTPEVDAQGVPQISPMQWAAWGRKQERKFAEAVEETGRRLHTPPPDDDWHHRPVRAGMTQRH